MTLDICGDKTIQNPTEDEIRQAVSTLDNKNNDAFLVLEINDMTYMQTSGDPKDGFILEYQENDVKHHYQSKRELAADEVVKALVLYSVGSDDWKQMAEWQWLQI
jgi:hypothetical protein